MSLGIHTTHSSDEMCGTWQQNTHTWIISMWHMGQLCKFYHSFVGQFLDVSQPALSRQPTAVCTELHTKFPARELDPGARAIRPVCDPWSCSWGSTKRAACDIAPWGDRIGCAQKERKHLDKVESGLRWTCACTLAVQDAPRSKTC